MKEESELATEKEVRRYAWNYFQLHAAQRMTVFNFYIAITAGLTTALAATFALNSHEAGVLLGPLIMLISFLFHKLDQRTQFLIAIAENSLKASERALSNDPRQTEGQPGMLFTLEEQETECAKKAKPIRFWNRHFTYGQCLKYIFFVFGLCGLAGGIGSVLELSRTAKAKDTHQAPAVRAGRGPAPAAAGLERAGHPAPRRDPPGRAPGADGPTESPPAAATGRYPLDAE